MAMLAEILALLQRETGERWSGGSQRRQAKGVPAKPIPTMSDVRSQVLECEVLSCDID
jgi:hypothetical protein